MERLQAPGELGYMILSDDGRFTESGGELKNNEKVASIVSQMKDALNTSANVLNDSVNNVTIQSEDHLYALVFEPRRSLVVKCKIPPNVSSSNISNVTS